MNIFSTYRNTFQGLSTESWMLSLVMLLNRIGGMVIPFLTVYLVTVLNFKTDQAGMVMSFFGIGGLVGSFVGGWLTDKIGSFYVQFFSLLLAAPIFITLYYLDTVVGVTIAVFILSFINTCFQPANSVAITSFAKKGNLTRSFSLNRMSINLGFSFGPAIGGFLATISYAWLFYGNSLTSLVAAIVFFWYFFNRNKRNEAVKEDIETPLEREINIVNHNGTAYKDKWFILFTFFCFLFACVFFQLIIVLPIFYEKTLQLSQATIGVLLAFNGIIVFLFEMPIVQYIGKRLNIYNTIAIGGLSLLLAFASLLIDVSLTSCFVSIFFLSISEILVMPFMATIAAERPSKAFRGSYMGLQGLSVSMAFVIMPYLATRIIEYHSFSTLWILNVIILIIGSVGFLFLKNKMPVL